jgi:lysophospholipase L1-like esterase
MLTDLVRLVFSAVNRGLIARPRRAAHPPRLCRGLAIEQLEDRCLPSAGVTIAALGDSLTAPYAGQPYVAPGEQNWVEQLRAHDTGRVMIDDLAVPGTTSDSLLAGGQVATAAELVHDHSVRYAVLLIGANDVQQHLPEFIAGNPAPFVSQVTANIESAVNTIEAAGHVRLVLCTIPDVTLTPAFQAEIAALAPSLAAAQALTGEISGAIQAANQQLVAFAASKAIPVVDFAGIEAQFSLAPPVVGGVAIDGSPGQANSIFGPDGFHPETVPQGLLGNAILDAFAKAYNPHLAHLRLTDQQILDDAGVAHNPGSSYFDLSSYILFSDSNDHHRDSHGPAEVDHDHLYQAIVANLLADVEKAGVN